MGCKVRTCLTGNLKNPIIDGVFIMRMAYDATFIHWEGDCLANHRHREWKIDCLSK